jgi:hypothetical protein
MLYAPLEQFQILSLVSIKLFNFDFSITNFLLINLLALLSFKFIYYNSSTKLLARNFLFFYSKLLAKNY